MDMEVYLSKGVLRSFWTCFKDSSWATADFVWGDDAATVIYAPLIKLLNASTSWE
jgi:hypothetical protein